MTQQALAGLKIIELSQGVAASYTGKLFADFGASVLKLEPPGRGDDARYLTPLKEGVSDPEASGMFAYLNTNKQSATLDLWSEKGSDLACRLCEDADIVIENYTPGALDRLGLGFRELCRRNPDIVLTSVTWFGQNGPYADFKGNDSICHALSGVSYYIGPKEGPTTLPGGYQAQIVGGLTSFVATMGALMGRTNGHGGQHIDISILEANLCFTETGAASFANTGIPGTREGINRFLPTFPTGIYPCKDGWLGITVLTPAQWEGFCDLIGLPLLKENPDYATTVLRMERADELEDIFAPGFLDRTAREWFHLAQAQRIPFAFVPTMAELLTTPQYRNRNAFAGIRHPDIDAFEAPAVPFKLLKTPDLQGGASPRLGQHNHDVYQGRLGLTGSEVDRLKSKGVI